MRDPSGLVEAFRLLPTTIVFEAQSRTGAMDPAIKPLDPASTLCGPAFTVWCGSYDNLALHRALAVVEAGQVLVVDPAGAFDAALFGEIMALAARARGTAGIVLDAHIRDSWPIRTLGFPTYCRGAAIRGSTKTQEGAMQVQVICGGVPVAPGDLIIGDADGVVVVGAGAAHEVLEGCRRRLEWEEKMTRGVAQGRTTVDLLGLLPGGRHE
jgi:4-hydroxy-4-methyl-2-oxoglutarate aldolase